ncbi:MAG: hypothetical protein ACUVX8_15345 [Candidatus Zipacnadales bacterium]
MTIVTLTVLPALAGGDRILNFAAREGIDGSVRMAEVTGAGRVILRLRSKSGSVLSRAQTAVRVLQEAALASFAPPTLATVKTADGQFVLMAGGRPVVTADKETAQIASLTPAALAESWRTTLSAIFREPYLIFDAEDPLVIPVEEVQYIRYGGPLGASLSATTQDTNVLALKVEPGERRVKVYSWAPGCTSVTLSSGNVSVQLSIIARYWAARIAASATAELSGTGHDETLAYKVAVNAALAGVALMPGATLGITSTAREGPVFRVGVIASGPDYLDTKRQVEVTLKWVPSPQKEPVDLLISNSPERIFGPGCLMREQLLLNGSERVLYHHVNDSGRKLMFVVRIANAGREPGAAHVILGEAGPDNDELSVGHTAAKRYWDLSRTGSGYILRIPPLSAADVVRAPLETGAIVSGLAQVLTLTPSPLFIEVQAELPRSATETMWVEPLDPENYAQPRLTGFRFSARKAVQLTHEIGGAWTFYTIGREGSSNDHGVRLAGDYGVLHEIDLTVTNPHNIPAWFEVHVRASGGVMRGLFLINNFLYETGLLRGSMQERLLKEEIEAEGIRRIAIKTIPESASNYPVHLVVHSQVRH